MAKPNFAINNNFKVCARIKPLEYSSRMLEVGNDNVVTIRDINNKTNLEKQLFHFNKVFDQNARQDQVFQYLCENAINKALEGTNCCILSYGQTGSGKTYTMYGDDEKFAQNTINLYSDSLKDKKGLIPKTIEYLLKKNREMEGVRELILTCNFVEIYLDQVRDLSRNYTDRNAVGGNQKRATSSGPYESENLEIYEHANGQMLIKNVRNVIIKTVEELNDLLASGFGLRDKAESKGSQIWSRAHTIFTINIVQKEVENEDLPFPKSMIQFVDLAGSERIAKSITEGQHKFQEAVLIMSHMTSLYKVLTAIASNSKNIPYRDSKLTKVLYNCLTPYNNIIMLAHLHPAESNFEETLNTLQYAERCKNTDFKDKRGLAGNPSGIGGLDESAAYAGASVNASNDKLWKKMTEEINDLKNKLEATQKEHKAKLERIQMYLGLDIDLEKVSSNTVSKEVQALTQLKSTYLENQNLKITIAQSEEQFEMMRREIDEERREFYAKLSKLESKNVELRESMRKDTDKFKTDKHKDEEDLRRQIQQLNDENKRLVESNTKLLQEKTEALMNFSSNLNVRTRDLNQTQDMKSLGKKEAELEFKDELAKLKADHKSMADSLKEQYEHWLNAKNEEMDRYVEKTNEYQRKKKEQMDQMKKELLELHHIAKKQEQIIEKIENGGYSGGIKSFFIPTKDKPLAPTRQKFPQLYKALDDKKSEVTSQTLYREKEGTGFMEDFKKSPPMGTSKSHVKFGATPNATATLSMSNRTSERDAQVDLEMNVNKLQIDDLKRYTENLRKYCRDLKDSEKDLREKADKFVGLNVYGDIHEIIKERDRYKELYKEESKRNNDNKVTIESQKRILSFSASKATVNKMRPTTSGWQ